MFNTYSEVRGVAAAAGTAFNTFTTAKTVLPAGCLVTLEPNFWYVGRKAIVNVRGGLSNIVTTPGTITFQVMIGSIVVWTSGAVQLNATAHTLLPFWLRVDLTCRAVGATTTANLMGMGSLSGIMFTLTAAQVDAVNVPGMFPVPATAPAVGTGFDSTAAGTLDFWAGFSISNIGNSIQIQDYYVEFPN